MAKYYGKIGYAVTTETAPGVWQDKIIEREHYGDINRNMRYLRGAEQLNDDIKINNELSIIADPFALENFHSMRYATYMGTKWKINAIEVQYPRLILSVGEVYNG